MNTPTDSPRNEQPLEPYLSTGGSHAGDGRKKAAPCDEPGFLAAQVFAIAAETGWHEERILFMPLARLAQYQHCLLRRNGVRTGWGGMSPANAITTQMAQLRRQWHVSDRYL